MNEAAELVDDGKLRYCELYIYCVDPQQTAAAANLLSPFVAQQTALIGDEVFSLEDVNDVDDLESHESWVTICFFARRPTLERLMRVLHSQLPGASMEAAYWPAGQYDPPAPVLTLDAAGELSDFPDGR
jgi:hypothetical protein